METRLKRDAVDGDVGWLSKSNPPRHMLQTHSSKSGQRQGALSRKHPPRMSLTRRPSSLAARLTQNSPPLPQLMTNTRQSSLLQYFAGGKTHCAQGEFPALLSLSQWNGCVVLSASSRNTARLIKATGFHLGNR
ncbi:uncharacterized protein LOC106011903 [Aplysia californica]|uniref:Uncharacterized protein LOC106011903 n=1 Tax=Aplysia californica TaxID=6500 RepID=A0ABM1A0U9_APLCA|nr:uncharacterized protein LOC106011903 [Aplysia californica]